VGRVPVHALDAVLDGSDLLQRLAPALALVGAGSRVAQARNQVADVAGLEVERRLGLRARGGLEVAKVEVVALRRVGLRLRLTALGDLAAILRQWTSSCCSDENVSAQTWRRLAARAPGSCRVERLETKRS
jgi:hypothetical protein